MSSVREMQGQLELEGLPRPLVRVTPAKLATWTTCPRRYRMTYLDRPPPPRGAPWAHNSLGAVVHNALRAWFELPPARREPAAAASLVDRHWLADGFADDEQQRRYQERARQWVADYVATLDAHLEPIGLERWVSAPVRGMVVEGRVDRIDEVDDELVVVDYKTGRHALSTDDARGSQALALYAVAAARTLRRPCRRVELHHLPTGEIVSWEHTEESLRRHLIRADEAADDLALATDTFHAGGDAETLFPPVCGPHCSWCDFRRHCPEGRAVAPEVQPWALLEPSSR